MRKHSIIIILGTAHRLRYPGKQSPDGRLHEAIYSREIVKEVAAELRAYGYHVMTDYEPLDLPTSMQSNSHVTETSRELAMRVAVRGMMPRNTITKDSLKRLHIYAGAQHEHQAQKPELVK